MSSYSQQGQHQTPQELLVLNAREVILDILRHLEGHGNNDVNIDYARYRLDWLTSLFRRFGQNFEKEAIVIENLQTAQSFLARLDNDIYSSVTKLPSLVATDRKGRPRFHIPREQLELYMEYGFKAADIARMVHVSVKTIYRRLEEYDLSIKNTYCDISDSELDKIVNVIRQDFPNCGYKVMRGHLLSRGMKVQENRVRETMRRTDPEGTVIRALQLRVTHRT
jgi:hypothetical protein